MVLSHSRGCKEGYGGLVLCSGCTESRAGRAPGQAQPWQMLQAGRSRSCAEGEELIADMEGVQPHQEKLPVPQQIAHPIKTSNRKQIWLLLTMCKLRVTPQQPVQFPRSCSDIAGQGLCRAWSRAARAAAAQARRGRSQLRARDRREKKKKKKGSSKL